MSRRRKQITVRVTFEHGDMLFGDSYRKWWDQLDEYLWLHRQQKLRDQIRAAKMVVSDAPWISFGGLKWCHITAFQEQLDIENEGRKLEDFAWRAPTQKEQDLLTALST